MFINQCVTSICDMNVHDIEIHHLVKDCNEALILAILFTGKKHGYQLALEIEEKSKGFFKFNHGTLYPILHKLEKEGLIDGIWKKEGPKRKRKQYSLTSKGKKYVSGQVIAWRRFFERFFEIMEDVDR